MKFIIKPIIIFIILSKILTYNKTLSPLSQCFKGRVSSYTGWENGGSCGFEPHVNATGPYYIYPIAPNEGLFNSEGHCGVCYEMVGLTGVIRVRVEDYCPKKDKSGYCSGDMYHFNVPEIGLNYLIGTEDLSKISFRMVDCGFSGNIRILMDSESDKFAISFIVLDHNLAVSNVNIQENQMNNWEKLDRKKNNYWSYDPGMGIEFPLKIRIYSIKGDYVTVNINELNVERIYEADGNFKESNDTFFNITTLEEEEMPNNTRSCCERDFSDFTPIYNNGEVNENYFTNIQKVTFDDNTTTKYDNKNTMKVKFQSKGKIIFKSNYPIRADQFSGVSIAMKASKNCSNCIYFDAYDLKKNINLNISSSNKWLKFRFDFETMGIENNQFNGIVLNYYQTNPQTFELYIGSIELIGKKIKPDAGVCLYIPFNGNEGSEGEEGGNIPIYIPEGDNSDTPQDNDSTTTKMEESTYIQVENNTDINTTINSDSDIISDNFTQSDNNTEIISEIIENNLTSLTYVNILSIEQKNPFLIYIKCENFTKIEDENMILLFESMNNSNSFKTENCNLDNDNEIISSFSCKLPEDRPNGEYKVKSPSENKYFINFQNIALVNNKEISFDIIDTTNKEIETQIETTISNDNTNSPNEFNSSNYTEITNSTDESNEQKEEITNIVDSPILIKNTIIKTVKKGERITFLIEPIEFGKYHLDNNEIVFTDSTKTKFLFLKECEGSGGNNKIEIIRCSVSNNIMKGEYTTLIDGKNIAIQSDHNINLIIDENNGGIVNEPINQINTKIPSSQLKNFNLTFNILYFNTSLSSYSLFPHKVALFGIKNNRRNLEETNYNSIINFTNCTTGTISKEESAAFGSIRCRFPDFVPAGIYSKLESDGFDVNPNSKINIVFNEDFKRNPSNDSDSDFNYQLLGDKSSSSSSSKTWIIWLVAGLLLLILIIIVIIACVCKSNKSSGESTDNSKYNDRSYNNMKNSNQTDSN